MNNTKRMLASLTLAAAAVAAAAPAHAAGQWANEDNGGVGHAVGKTLADPTGTSKEVLDAGKTGLSVAETGLQSVQTGTQAAGGR
ncbi:hypothetical protein [Streptomyces sp. NPDC047123]|uniref:hypothetical protein n=1 Tax=unclassified Streptomyces TaxID=2593676 RepID=UPI003408497F